MKVDKVHGEYKWNIGLVYKDSQEFFDTLEKVRQDIEKLKLFKGKLSDKEKFVEYIRSKVAMSKALDRATLYAFLLKSQDNADPKALKMYGQIKDIHSEIGEKLAFELPELSKLSNKALEDYEKDPRLKDYDRSLYLLRLNKKHILSEKEEKLLAGVSKFTDFDELFDALDNVEIKFESVVMPDGTRTELTNTSYEMLSKHKDREVRRQAFENLHEGFSKFNLTLSQNFINQLNCSSFYAKTSRFGSTLESKLFYEEIDAKIYDYLIKNVNNNLELLHKYIEAKRKKLGNEDFYIYDIYAPTRQDADTKIEYEEGYSLVKKATQPLGSEYSNILDRAKNEGWIDVYPSPVKENGAFSVSTGTGNPFVLLNYQPNINNVSTLAHELGHAMHSYYSENSQPYPKRNYVIFVAEVASTVNELLLSNYILKNADSQSLKDHIVDGLLGKFYSTVFRQTMFSEFEQTVHDLANRNQPLAFDVLNETYGGLQKKYFGKNVKYPKFAEYEWSRIPHFYRPFYVYKYATGLICAIAIVEKLEQGTKDYATKYINFLKSGSSSDPVSLLKIAEIDISKQETFDYAFKYFEKLLKMYSSN